MMRHVLKDRRAVIVIEFAYVLPIFMLLGFTAIEIANFAITNMRVSQITMTVADNLSRAKQSVPLGLPRLREVDINDNLIGAKIQGGDDLEILEQGRIIVSSLQRNGSGRQTIAWQRCKGKLNAVSLYGTEGATQPNNNSSGFQGMGAGPNRVQAEPNSAVIFAEVVYSYQPLFGEWIMGKPQIRREAAFYVRDDRDLTKVYNDEPRATDSSCSKFDSTF